MKFFGGRWSRRCGVAWKVAAAEPSQQQYRQRSRYQGCHVSPHVVNEDILQSSSGLLPLNKTTISAGNLRKRFLPATMGLS
jgi:hypothetical protein